MGQVTITLNGRSYRLRCGVGEEPRLMQLADLVRTKLQQLVGEYGQVGDDRLLLMSALLIADELIETRAQLAAVTTMPATAAVAPPAPVEQHWPEPPQPPPQMARTEPADLASTLAHEQSERATAFRARLERNRADRAAS